MKRIKPKIKPTMYAITDYDSNKYDKESLRKWCIEQASLEDRGQIHKPDLIRTAQKIYDWVTK